MTPIPPGHRVAWKPYILINPIGNPYLASTFVLDHHGNRFLHEIEAMGTGTPISFLVARKLVHEAKERLIYQTTAASSRSDAQLYGWIEHDWVQWIAQQGYRIVLDGSEWGWVRHVAGQDPPLPIERPISITFGTRGPLTTDRRAHAV